MQSDSVESVMFPVIAHLLHPQQPADRFFNSSVFRVEDVEDLSNLAHLAGCVPVVEKQEKNKDGEAESK